MEVIVVGALEQPLQIVLAQLSVGGGDERLVLFVEGKEAVKPALYQRLDGLAGDGGGVRGAGGAREEEEPMSR